MSWSFHVFPCTVLIDCAEQLPYALRTMVPDFDPEVELCPPEDFAPYSFSGFFADADKHNLPLVVPTRVASLTWGDYSLEGFPGVAVERKSKGDLYSTLGARREEFEREIAALNEPPYDRACVVVESTFKSLRVEPPERSKMRPKSVLRTVVAWAQRYHRVQWFFMDDREEAERFTFRYLERYWRDRTEGGRKANPVAIASGRPTG